MGTTAQKLTYLNTTKGLIKDSINALGGNLTNESTFRSYAAALDSIYNVLPKTTGTGTTLSLSPTLKGLMQIDLKGNTSQVQLSGKNLFGGFTYTNTGYIGISFTYNNNGTILIDGTNNTGTTAYSMTTSDSTPYQITLIPGIYTISGGLSNAILQVINSSGSLISQTNSSVFNTTFTLTQQTKIYVRVQIANGVSFSNKTIYIMLEKNSTATTYEQYCGGTPSPNPSYPQDIHNVSGNNSIEVCGKNLFDKSNYSYIEGIIDGSTNKISLSNGRITIYIPCKSNTTYTISKILSSRFVIGTTSVVPNDKVEVDGRISNNSATSITITTGNNAKYLCAFVYHNSYDSSLQNIIDSIQIEYGNQATTYEAYQSQTYPITLPAGMELCKIGTYQDYIYKEDDKWYLHKEIGYKVLNGTEDWKYSISNRVFYVDEWLDRVVGSNEMYYDYFNVVPLNTSYANMVDGNTRIDTGTNGRSVFKFSTYTSANDFKNWLSTHNVKSYYQLATPTNIEITDTTLINQLEAIKGATSYNGTTNILQTNNDLPFIIDASCLKGA